MKIEEAQVLDNGLDQGYGIVANVCAPDSCFRMGAKCWLVGGTNGEGFDRFRFYGMSRGGRMIEKWCPANRLHNFRPAWIPPKIRAKYPNNLYLEAVKCATELSANRINIYNEIIRGY